MLTATRSGDLIPWLPPLLCIWCARNFFQLVKINPHRPLSPSSSQTYLSAPSRSKRRVVLFHHCVPECLIRMCYCSHELEVCALEGVSDAFVVEHGHHGKWSCLPQFEEILCASQSRKQVHFFRESHCERICCVRQDTIRCQRLWPVWELSLRLPPLSAGVRGGVPSLPATHLDSSDCDLRSCW